MVFTSPILDSGTLHGKTLRRTTHVLWNAREALNLILPVQVQARFNVKRFFLPLVACFFAIPQMPAQNTPASTSSWSGIVVSSACDADEAFNGSVECNKDVPGAKLALYDDTNRVMYSLEPQASVNVHLGDIVTARGTLDGETIRITSIEPIAIGLSAGQKAPEFSLRDQFGHLQTLDTLKGANGTVLLFFRSADW